jgi:hypothetical protein
MLGFGQDRLRGVDMTKLTRSLLLVVLGLVLAGAAHAQFGGGRGGAQAPGGGNAGSRGGRQPEESLDGSWFLEFELEFDSNNPQNSGERISIRADVTVTGVEVNARFRRPAEGEFSCTVYEGSDRCESGRLLIVWPDTDFRESASFEFVVDRIDGRRAKGEANFVNSGTGAVRLYSVEMRKR